MSWCKGGGGGGGRVPKTDLPPTFSCNGNDSNFRQTNLTNALRKCHTNIINILSISFLELSGGGAENNLVRSSISDQCYFYAKYNKKDIY